MNNVSTSRSLFAFLIAGVGLAHLPAPLAAQRLVPGQSFSAEYSFSGKSDLSRGPKLGEASVNYYRFNYAYAFAVDEALLLSAGLDYDVADFSLEGSLPLPDKLQELALSLSAQYQLDPQWSLLARVSPGYSGSGSGFDSKAFGVPVALAASYAQSRELIWVFGAAYRPFSEYPVLPYAAVLWQFAPRWTLSTGFPRVGVSYEVNPELTFSLNVSAKGGSYWIKETPGYLTTQVVGMPSLPAYKNTKMDYREIRVGLGMDYAFDKSSKLSLEAGMAVDREFEYHKLDQSYDGKAAAYVSLALEARF